MMMQAVLWDSYEQLEERGGRMKRAVAEEELGDVVWWKGYQKNYCCLLGPHSAEAGEVAAAAEGGPGWYARCEGR